MKSTAMTAFLRYPEEAAIVGRLLASFGELEFLLALCLDRALRKKPGDNQHIGIKALFRLRSESSRPDVADAMMRDAAGLEAAYADAIGALRYCLRIRNQFAHCHWGADLAKGLFIYADFRVRSGMMRAHMRARPPAVPRPPLHDPLEEHVLLSKEPRW